MNQGGDEKGKGFGQGSRMEVAEGMEAILRAQGGPRTIWGGNRAAAPLPRLNPAHVMSEKEVFHSEEGWTFLLGSFRQSNGRDPKATTHGGGRRGVVPRLRDWLRCGEGCTGSGGPI